MYRTTEISEGGVDDLCAHFGELIGGDGAGADGGEIDSLSGATVTSRAVANGVNAALACAAGLS